MSTPTQQADTMASFFDERADDYVRQYNNETPGGYALRVRRDKALELLDQREGKVLDVGCGPGVMAQEIVNRGGAFWGVDPSRRMIELCRQRFGGNQQIHFLLGDAMRLALPSGFFDAVLCMGVIDGLRDRRQAVREMLRVLKPGGTLVITFTNLLSPYAWWKKYVFYPAVSYYRKFCGDRRTARRRASPPVASERTLYNKRAARALLQSEGADVVQIVGWYFNVFLSPLDELLPSLALWVTRKFEEGYWLRPEWIAAGWIVKARKKLDLPENFTATEHEPAADSATSSQQLRQSDRAEGVDASESH